MVVKVLCKPAFNPLGGSLVTLIECYNKLRGNKLWGSQVIHNLKSSWMNSWLSIILSNYPIKSRPKWQFCKITQDPIGKAFSSSILAILSWPSPMETFSYGYFFFFLANSSIDDYGSAPADNKKRIGSKLVLSSKISSIG